MSVAWEQFLIGKRAMLDQFNRARDHSMTLPVKTAHGPAAEAAFRDWLVTFLPKRYGVTSGYIRGQSLRTRHDDVHFDVIIFDQLNSPILWIEDNKDKAESGRSRIVPADQVCAVIEVKSSFSTTTVRDAADKLRQLRPLVEKVDVPGERYPSYLRSNVALAMVFFELPRRSARDIASLEVVRDFCPFPRPFYGAVVLSGEGLHRDAAAKIQVMLADSKIDQIIPPDRDLFFQSTFSPTYNIGGQNIVTHMMWSDLAFSEFAFDLLAVMNGTYDPNRISSWHVLDFTKYPLPPPE